LKRLLPIGLILTMAGVAYGGTVSTSAGTGSIYTIIAGQAVYVATGAGDANANGTYQANGTSGGKTAYQNEHGYWMYYNSGWKIDPTEGLPSSVKYGDGTGTTPDGTYSPGIGTPPAPTVTASLLTGMGAPVTIK
jgi:hypothetical protein